MRRKEFPLSIWMLPFALSFWRVKGAVITLALWAMLGGVFAAENSPATLKISFAEKLGPLEIDRFALGQGGLSEEPMWDNRIPEIRALSPRIIRLFIQEYFDLLPEGGQYHFETLDRSVETILRTGAKPVMCICFKPRVLFPEVNHDIVEPNDYAKWEQLIENLVRHYRERNAGIRFWEVANEPDIGEDGGCPYRFKPDSYVRYYRHTVDAIRRADANALVGGPALANVRSAILPALLEFCAKEKAPLDFVSWHIYTSDPLQFRGTINYVHDLLKKFPTLKPETMLDEWNMALGSPPSDPRIQPCYVAETAWQMKDAGLDYSCYYHIRDYHVSFERFAPFMSPKGTAFMTGWWNRMPQYHGLFDFQNNVRPAYFTFKLLARLNGERLRVTASNGATVHALAARDDRFPPYQYNLLAWNFSATATPTVFAFEGIPGNLRVKPVVLDAATPNNDEIMRLRAKSPITLSPQKPQIETILDPYAVWFWSFEIRP